MIVLPQSATICLAFAASKGATPARDAERAIELRCLALSEFLFLQ
jgi:hypothetical protein